MSNRNTDEGVQQYHRRISVDNWQRKRRVIHPVVVVSVLMDLIDPFGVLIKLHAVAVDLPPFYTYRCKDNERIRCQ